MRRRRGSSRRSSQAGARRRRMPAGRPGVRGSFSSGLSHFALAQTVAHLGVITILARMARASLACPHRRQRLSLSVARLACRGRRGLRGPRQRADSGSRRCGSGECRALYWPERQCGAAGAATRSSLATWPWTSSRMIRAWRRMPSRGVATPRWRGVRELNSVQLSVAVRGSMCIRPHDLMPAGERGSARHCGLTCASAQHERGGVVMSGGGAGQSSRPHAAQGQPPPARLVGDSTSARGGRRLPPRGRVCFSRNGRRLQISEWRGCAWRRPR